MVIYNLFVQPTSIIHTYYILTYPKPSYLNGISRRKLF